MVMPLKRKLGLVQRNNWELGFDTKISWDLTLNWELGLSKKINRELGSRLFGLTVIKCRSILRTRFDTLKKII